MKKNVLMLFHYIGNVKWAFTFTMVLIVIHIVAQVGMTWMQKFIVDDVFIAKHFHLIWLYAAIFLGVILTWHFLFIYVNHYMRLLENRMKSNLFKDMLSRMQQFPITRLQKERTGKLVEHLTKDVDGMTRYTLRDLPFSIQDLLHAILLSILIAKASFAIFLIVLAAASLFFILGKKMGLKYKAVGTEVTESRSHITVATEEAISSTREVLAFNRGQWEQNRFDRLFDKYLSGVKKQFRLDIIQGYLSEPLLWGVQLVVIAYGGYLVIRREMTIGTFVVIFQFVTQAIWNYRWVMAHFFGFSSRISIFDRVHSILESETVEDGTRTLNESIKQIQIKNIQFTYPGLTAPVLKHMNMNIPVGKTAAIVGESGGGKSTLAQLLMRSYTSEEGEILINNQPLKETLRSDWYSRISIVFQDAYLFPDTIATNLLMGAGHTQDEVERVCKAMQIHDTILAFPQGYQTEVGERGIQLSGGQRQRVVLARAMLRNTEILILDEATSALDYETERQVYKNIRAMREGKTTIIIAHRLSTIQDADLIYVINDGRVEDQGAHQNMMVNSNLYRKLVAAGDV